MSNLQFVKFVILKFTKFDAGESIVSDWGFEFTQMMSLRTMRIKLAITKQEKYFPMKERTNEKNIFKSATAARFQFKCKT